MMKTYLITGGAGFIGCNFVKYILQQKKDVRMIVLDKLSYAGSKENLREEINTKKIEFIRGNICNQELLKEIFCKFDIDYVVNFAAETHVDRSIENPKIFVESNILGTQTLLDTAKEAWIIGKDEEGYPLYRENKKYLQISTDEVYGSLEKHSMQRFTEQTPLSPNSPYAASKASADMMVLAYKKTYHMPINITRCSNNYGAYQFPEKLIPKMIGNILQGKRLPIYEKGENIRDWVYVEDHCKAIDLVLEQGKIGEIYNIGGFNEEANINIVTLIIEKISDIVKENPQYKEALKTDVNNINKDLIHYVQDRLGHDARYAIDPSKIVKDLGWCPEITFQVGIEKTIRWYLENREIFE